MAITLKQLTYLLPTPVILLYLFAFTTLLYLGLGIKQGLRLGVSWQPIALLGLASVFAFIGNLADVEALKLAPNPGYASAVKAGQIILITFAAVFLFPDQKLTLQGILGGFSSLYRSNIFSSAKAVGKYKKSQCYPERPLNIQLN